MPTTEAEKRHDSDQTGQVEETKDIEHHGTEEDNYQRCKDESEDGPTMSTEHNDFEVTWDGDDDPSNPLNWSTMRKASIIAMVSFVTFLT